VVAGLTRPLSVTVIPLMTAVAADAAEAARSVAVAALRI
jgi:hypothetical protein